MLRQFTVLGEPKGKGRHITTKKGISFTPKATVMYENYVKSRYIELYDGQEMFDGMIKVNIIAYFNIPKSTTKKKRDLMEKGLLKPTKKPDTDNVAKSILDSLNKIAFNDDSQVVDLHVTKEYSIRPRVEVTLEEIKGTEE